MKNLWRSYSFACFVPELLHSHPHSRGYSEGKLLFVLFFFKRVGKTSTHVAEIRVLRTQDVPFFLFFFCVFQLRLLVPSTPQTCLQMSSHSNLGLYISCSYFAWRYESCSYMLNVTLCLVWSYAQYVEILTTVHIFLLFQLLK